MTDQHPSQSAERAGRRRGAISVGPVQGGWRVEAALCGQALMFLSGACAERQARALARRLAGAGYDMHLEVRDRRNAVAGSFRYQAAPLAAEGPGAAFEGPPGYGPERPDQGTRTRGAPGRGPRNLLRRAASNEAEGDGPPHRGAPVPETAARAAGGTSWI